MKLLHLASEYPPARIYGLGRFVHGLARAQAAQGDEVHVLTNSHGGAEDDAVVEGVRLHRIAFPNPPRPSDGHGEVLQWNHGVVSRLLDRRALFEDVDLIVGHDWLTGPAARETARILDRPLALVVHDEVVGKHAGVLDAEARFVRDLEALAVHDANLVIANSEYIARQVVRHYGVPAERLVAIHGGIDPAFADTAPTSNQEDFRAALAAQDEVLVAYVGRLDPEKGLGVLGEAAELLAERASGVRLVVAGSGRREGALRARLGGRGRLLGYVKGEALVRLLHAADVVVVPSVYEPFGLVALEAMACGACVVVSDSGGLPEIVRSGQDGLVVSAGDPRALADAVAALAADPRQRRALAAAARRRAREDFAWEVIARRSREAYVQIVGQRPALLTRPPSLPTAPTVSAIVVTRHARAGAEATARSLALRCRGLLEVLILSRGEPGDLEEVAAELTARAGLPVRVILMEAHLAEDGALLVALEATRGERILVTTDEVELIPGEGDLLDGLLWLLDDARAAVVSPHLISRSEAAGPSEPDLAEQRRLVGPQRALFLARRSELRAALAGGGRRLLSGADSAAWEHPARAVHAPGEARRDAACALAAAPDSPLPASIVVVAYGRLDLTRECLEAVLAHTAPPYELVLVDNGSRDGTLEYFRALRDQLGPATPVQLVRCGSNLGYPAGANRGVRAARGRHVVLLNNDTRVERRWLAGLLQAAESRPDVGLVTAKVLHLDLTVQSAGGILHAPDGSFTIPGQGASRTAPSVNQRRLVPSAGGPCLLATRPLIERLARDGALFDEVYSPGYFEDSDLCMRAREAGFTLVYEPSAEVLHHGKATADLVAREGSLDVWGRFEANRRHFHARWAAQLARDAADEAERERSSRSRRALEAAT